MPNASTAYDQFKSKLRLRLAKMLEADTRGGERTSLDRSALSSQLRAILEASRREPQRGAAISEAEQERLIEELAGEIVGTGPLEALLADPTVTEIMVNGPRQVFVEREGRLERTPATFQSNEHLISIIERLLDRAGLSVSEAEPCVDASLPDGTRINVIIPPLVLNGPTITIRKKTRQWTMEDLVSQASLSREMAEFLALCVKVGVNLVISGGTSTGKTTLVSVLSTFIPKEARVITIENVAELELPEREHWVRLVSRIPNVQGRGEVSLRALVRNALRMRPDRLILGEARSGEALDVIQAMTTGHEGVITVLHANSPRSALERLETLMLMSGLELPPQTCRAQVASAVELVIHMARFADGSRRIGAITQVMGASRDGYELEELFATETQGTDDNGQLSGACRYTGVKPKFLAKLQFHNVKPPAWLTTS